MSRSNRRVLTESLRVLLDSLKRRFERVNVHQCNDARAVRFLESLDEIRLHSFQTDRIKESQFRAMGEGIRRERAYLKDQMLGGFNVVAD